MAMKDEEAKGIYSAIVLNNVERERKTLSKYACLNLKGQRRHPDHEKTPDRENIRPIFFHDTDKIMHSLSYSRYIDKTQAFYLFDNDHITHRVLHVQFVSKIGRVIGRCLKLNEDLIEAIALGHDLGHVPYGHDGEKILNNICEREGIGRFCHNAQSVRFLMEIENGGRGLNLALQTLDGILAHNGELISDKYVPLREKKWSNFLEEYERCFEEKNASLKITPMTLEGCVVRIADVIAYIGRDIEDAIKLKIIRREELPREATSILGNSNDQIINKLVMDLIASSHDKESLSFSPDIFTAINILKDFNMERIYFDPRIKTESQKIENMFNTLFALYKDDLASNKLDTPIYKYFLNEMSKEYRESSKPSRQVIDFISGMTDGFFNNRFNELMVPSHFGHSLPD